MGVPRRNSEGLVGGPAVSPGLCWLRASLELGRSRRAATCLPFRVKDIKKGFAISEINQGEIREACGALEKKLDLLVLRTQALEEAVGEMRVEISNHKKEIDLLKGNEQALQSKLEQ
ncbi:hypothetical protein NDU88_007487 [Pleurodeles waltl]|uniref:Uncharacterized protein n=1 Tax=Pleurodeles waltl TaxID=8319 RepID=A0AAV7RU91_PLEWA|nr:hypothetical protein NDU88_007487 [Pleurodeles waltl]